MKKKKLLHMMDLTDEKYVAEAAPHFHGRRASWRRFALVAACLCLVLTGVNLWLFLPYSTTPPDVSAYRDSDYYSLIEKLNVYTYTPPAYKNNFEKWTEAVEDAFLAGSGMGDAMAPTDAPTSDGKDYGNELGSGKYEEVTDNQVAGVIEADLFKRSDRYIYYASGSVLYVYSIAGEDSAEIASYTLPGQVTGIYLSTDCTTVTVIMGGKQQTILSTLHVEDPSAITEGKRITVSGSYASSRMVDGELLLLTKHTVYKKSIRFDEESTYLPQITDGEESRLIAADQIYTPDVISNLNYTIIYKLDGKTLEEQDSAAFLSYSDIFYVDKTHIYATRRYTETTDTKSWRTNEVKTEIVCISYTGEEIARVGSVTLDGYLHDQYSIDAYNGILRVVTSTDKDSWQIGPWNGSFSDLPDELRDERSANLYCMDIATWEIVAEVIGFAPQGEQVESVRFDGDSAYVCTAVVVTLTDPVFFFDLSDLDNITYKDTGEIEGYSSSLVNFAPGYLLGIGVGDEPNTLKIEVYKESDRQIISVAKYEIPTKQFTLDYKAYYIDRENGLIGFAVWKRTGLNLFDRHDESNCMRYIVLRFENETLKEVLNMPFTNSPKRTRSVYIDGYFYVFSDTNFTVQDPTDPEFIPILDEYPVEIKIGTKYVTTFTDEKALAFTDYLLSLPLTSFFSENPEYYNGDSYTVTLLYANGDQIVIDYHADTFIRRADGAWQKILWPDEDIVYMRNMIFLLHNS